METPTFFFSHARQDRETPGKYLPRFFKDLEVKVAQFAAIDLKERRLGTIDTRIEQGENWDANLSLALENDNVFVAIFTPLYFNRQNCAKELGVFLLRSPNLGIDANGALTGVKNLVPIRWLPEYAYSLNTSRDSLIPGILRLIEDTPADNGADAGQTAAIERYRRSGMEACVISEPDYTNLLNLFAARIRDMASLKLPPASDVSFPAAIDAFRYDWNSHFASISAVPGVFPSPVKPLEPRPLSSIVAFYVTSYPLETDSSNVDFADTLVAETADGSSGIQDLSFRSLLTDFRAAGVAEGLNVFHAAAIPAVPDSPEALLARLKALSKSQVLTALVVDRTVWPGSVVGAGAAAAAIESLIRSPDWVGPVFLCPTDATPLNVSELVAAHGLPARVVALPQASKARVALLRRAFIEARGQMLRTKSELLPEAESLPMLKGAGGAEVR